MTAAQVLILLILSHAYPITGQADDPCRNGTCGTDMECELLCGDGETDPERIDPEHCVQLSGVWHCEDEIEVL